MYCTKCGAQIPEDSAFCPKCGAPIAREVSSGNASKNPQPNNYAYQRSTDNHNSSPNNYDATNQMPKMKWYKVLIYGGIFVYPLIGLIEFIVLMFGLSPIYYMPRYYEWFPGLHAMHIIFGLIFLALGIIAIYIRQLLVNYKKGADKCFISFIVIWAVIVLLFPVILNIVAPGFFGFVGTLLYDISFISKVVYIILNYNYFNKRAYLFIN